ncbi:MAG: hypothetical protein IGR76_08885 [Synechococcales cyanobacterium T60_A2020_003]|nr:hypothetical protein [Synechococcales cyanobacterium T60_A2020_003]
MLSISEFIEKAIAKRSLPDSNLQHATAQLNPPQDYAMTPPLHLEP